MVQDHYALTAKNGCGYPEAWENQKIKRKTTIEISASYLSCYFAFFSLI
jgi:hypothetical protein